MKKFLTILMISLAFVITSCGFNSSSDEEGTVSFTIPAEQVQALMQQARTAAARVSGENIDASLYFLVQVNGSKGYYEKQTQIVGKTYSHESTQDESFSVFADLTKDVSFSFEGLSPKQTYTVLADVFFHYDYPDPDSMGQGNQIKAELLEPDYSLGMMAESDVIKVKGKKYTPVALSLKEAKYKYIDIIVEYDKNGTTETRRVNSEELVEFGSSAISAKFGYKDSDLYFKYQGFPWYKVKSIKAALSDDIHFKKGFEIKGTGYEFDSSTRTEKEVEIPSENGTYDITKYIEKGFAFYTTVDGVLLNIDQILNIRVLSSIEALDTAYFEYEDALVFTHGAEDYGNEADTYRYRATIPLSSLFPYDTLAANDTIVFVFNVQDPDDLPTKVNNQGDLVGKLYYQLQNAGWELLTPQEKDSGNTCIDYSENTSSFIMACNFIKGTEKYLQIFFDASDEVSSKQIDCDISYKKYDASEKVFAFRSNVAYNDQGRVIASRYRWEGHMPFAYDFDENAHNFVKADVTGNLVELVATGQTGTLDGTTFHANIVDSSDFTSAAQSAGHNDWYDVLTMGIPPEWTYGDSGTVMKFNFTEAINSPGETETGTHNYYLQCYSDISDWGAFLIIKNYTGLILDVTESH